MAEPQVPPAVTEYPQFSIDALARIHDPALMLNDCNHREWLDGLCVHLMRVQMDDILECVNPAAGAFRTFKGFIAIHVPKSFVPAVRAAPNPPALMRRIAEEYAPSSAVHVVTMRTHLSQLKQGPMERVSKYIDRGRHILHDLHAAGDTTTEAFVVTQLLMGLRAEFQDEAKHVQRTNVPHTFAAIAQPLRDAERNMVAMGSIVYPDATAEPHVGYTALLDYRVHKHALDDDADISADVLYAAGGKRRKGGQGRPLALGGDTHAGQARPMQSGHGGPAAGVSTADVGQFITPELIGQALQIALSRLDRGGAPRRRGNGASGNRHDPNIVCMRCQQKGHIARDCMAAKPVSAAQNGRSSDAGAVAHRVHYAMPLVHDLPGPLDGASAADAEHVQEDGEHAH